MYLLNIFHYMLTRFIVYFFLLTFVGPGPRPKNVKKNEKDTFKYLKIIFQTQSNVIQHNST